jgi:hypothetical protein
MSCSIKPNFSKFVCDSLRLSARGKMRGTGWLEQSFNSALPGNVVGNVVGSMVIPLGGQRRSDKSLA